MIEIHGGGWSTGYSTYYPGWPLVSRSNGNMILVNIQYRLGGFGFLASKAVRADGTANAALLDQRAAFEWVQRHIASFGGDPKRVTISGGSAGGMSVALQMILYGGASNPPFHAGIAEYGTYGGTNSMVNDIAIEAQYQQLLQLTKCMNLACLRRVSE
jgi:carboxylesterase type B